MVAVLLAWIVDETIQGRLARSLIIVIFKSIVLVNEISMVWQGHKCGGFWETLEGDHYQMMAVTKTHI